MPAENLHTRLLDSLTTAILLVDADMCVSYLNPAAEGLLESSHARVLGERIERVLAEDSDTVASLRRVLDSGVGYTKRQARLHLGPGRELTVDYAVTAVPLESGALVSRSSRSTGCFASAGRKPSSPHSTCPSCWCAVSRTR
jgi:two-component system nitrogen regulation sensor histidine kinase GlnL